MKKTIYLLLLLLLVSCGSDKTTSLSLDAPKEFSSPKITVQTILSNMEKGRYREGELLVKFKSGVVTTSSLKTHQAIGATSLKRFAIVPNLEHVKLPEGLLVKDAIIQYMKDYSVEYAEPNYIKHISMIPNDPLLSQQWGLTNIKAPQAWDITTGNRGIIVAVLDTGIDLNHPDLSANIIPGFNFIVNNNVPMDDEGHGTHVSGIIGAVGNNGIGIAGLMWNVQIMPLKILDASGSGYVSDEILAIQFAIAHGAKVINASFAGPDFVNSEFDVINQANSAGVLVMAAASNDGTNNDTTPQYPANYSLPNIISATATDQSDGLATFSNFGLNSVHVAAPGVNILSTIPGNTYGTLSGTSQATPYVSGLAGLLYSYYTNFTYSQIRGTILRYVDILPTLNGRIMTGGRINAYKALSSLLTPTGLNAGVQSSTQILLTWTDNATGEGGYKIERKTGGGSFSQITTLGPNSTTAISFTDSGLTDGTTYTYRVRAFNSLPNPPSSTPIEANSSYSNETSTTTSLSLPTGLTATAISTSQVNLAWTDNSQSEEGYKIERKGPGGDFVQITTVGPNITTYTDSGLSASTTYTYRVKAFSIAAGNSQYSNESSVTTPNEPGQGGGGGGGCSIGARQNTPTAIVDSMLLLVPLAAVMLLRRRRY